MKRFRRRLRRPLPRPLTARRRWLYALLVALPILAIFAFGNRGLINRIRLEGEVVELREQLYRDRRTGDSLRTEITRMKNDTVAIERLARERFGMARPGETIYRIDE